MDYRKQRRSSFRRPGRPIAVAAAALAMAVAGAPAAADAATLTEGDVNGSLGPLHVLRFTAAPGENNNLAIGADSDGRIWFSDVVAITSFPSPRCGYGHKSGPDTPAPVSCKGDGVDQIQVLAGNGDNEVHLSAPYPAYMSGSGATHNRFFGGDDPDTLIGDGGSDVLRGGSGGDLLEGRGGHDELRGGVGTDALFGGADLDLLDGGSGADSLRGGTGIDGATYEMRADPVNVTIGAGANDGQAGEGDDVRSDVENVTGGGGNDRIIAQSGAVANTLHGGLGNDTLSGGEGDDVLYGGGGADPLSGGPGADRLYGEAGSDLLDGDLGDDLVSGGADPDGLEGGAGADLLSGGAGEDEVSYASSTGAVTVDLDGSKGDDGAAGEGDSVTADVEKLIGSPFGDTLTGNAARNSIDGRAGADRIDGRAGNDQLLGQSGDDTMLSADGAADSVFCGDGKDATDADPVDTLSDCERDAAAESGAQTGRPGSKLRVGPARVRLTRRGIARLSVACPADAVDGCSGTVRMRRRLAGRLRTIGSRRFSVAAGRRGVVRVRVSRAARLRLGDAGLRVRVAARTANPKSIGSSTRLVRVLPAKGV